MAPRGRFFRLGLGRKEVEEWLESSDPQAVLLRESAQELLERRIQTEVARTLRIAAGFCEWEHAPDLRRQILLLAEQRDPSIRLPRATRSRMSTIKGVTRDD